MSAENDSRAITKEEKLTLIAEKRQSQQELMRKFRINQRLGVRANPKRDGHELFKQGFVFKVQPRDENCVPKDYDGEFDLFHHFYKNLILSGVKNHYISEIHQFFLLDGKLKPRCFCPNLPTINERAVETIDARNNQHSVQYISGDFNSPAFAIERIEPETIILQEKPLIFCKAPNCTCSGFENFECSYCTRAISVIFKCDNCNIAIYCSKECLDRAFREYHSFECMANQYHFFGLKSTALVAFRMLTIGALNAFDRSTANKYANIQKALRGRKIFPKTSLPMLRNATLMLLYLVNYTNFIQFVFETKGWFPNFTKFQRHSAVGGLLLRYMKQAEMSSLYFPNELISFTKYTEGHNYDTPALCIEAWKFEHSCNPNAALVFCGNFYYIKAIKAIMPGDAISINYIHPDASFYEIRCDKRGRCNYCENEAEKYTGRYLICPKCKAKDAMCLPPVILCQICEVYVNWTIDFKISRLDQYLQSITAMDGRNFEPKILISYIRLYTSLYSRTYPDYVYVVQKLITLGLENHIQTFNKFCQEFVDRLKMAFSIYSPQKMDIIISVICAFLTFITTNSRMSSVTLLQYTALAKYLLAELRPITAFHSLKPQYKELKRKISLVEDDIVNRSIIYLDDTEKE